MKTWVLEHHWCPRLAVGAEGSQKKTKLLRSAPFHIKGCWHEVGASVLPKSDTLSYSLPCLWFKPLFPAGMVLLFCYSTEEPQMQEQTTRDIRKRACWQEGVQVVPSSRRRSDSRKDGLWKKPPEQCGRGVWGKDHRTGFEDRGGTNPKTHRHLQGRSLHLCGSP